MTFLKLDSFKFKELNDRLRVKYIIADNKYILPVIAR